MEVLLNGKSLSKEQQFLKNLTLKSEEELEEILKHESEQYKQKVEEMTKNIEIIISAIHFKKVTKQIS